MGQKFADPENGFFGPGPFSVEKRSRGDTGAFER